MGERFEMDEKTFEHMMNQALSGVIVLMERVPEGERVVIAEGDPPDTCVSPGMNCVYVACIGPICKWFCQSWYVYTAKQGGTGES